MGGYQISDKLAFRDRDAQLSHDVLNLLDPEKIAGQDRMLVDRHLAVLVFVQFAIFEHVVVPGGEDQAVVLRYGQIEKLGQGRRHAADGQAMQ